MTIGASRASRATLLLWLWPEVVAPVVVEFGGAAGDDFTHRAGSMMAVRPVRRRRPEAAGGGHQPLINVVTVTFRAALDASSAVIVAFVATSWLCCVPTVALRTALDANSAVLVAFMAVV